MKLLLAAPVVLVPILVSCLIAYGWSVFCNRYVDPLIAKFLTRRKP